MSHRLVVFNADDLGISPGTNAGIAAAAANGVVREVSLCVTGEAVEEAASWARRQGARVGVGLHLSLTLGRALTGPIDGITDRQARFLPLGRVLASCVRGRPSQEAVEAEIRAQLARVRALGLPLTHLNGHQHVHAFPRVRDALLAVLRTQAVPHVRLPREGARTGGLVSPRRWLIAGLTRGLCRRAAAAGVLLPSLPFVGLGLHDRPDYARRLLATAGGLRAPATEWMVHPRAPDDAFPRLDRHAAGAYSHHAAELLALSDPGLGAALRGLGLAPASYAEVGGTQAAWASTAAGDAGRS